MADVLTYAALGWITSILDDSTYYIGWGTGATAAARNATTLSSETGSRKAATDTRITVAQTYDTLKVVATMTAAGTVTITNAGVWTASSAGTLLMMTSHAGVDLILNETIQYTFKLQLL